MSPGVAAAGLQPGDDIGILALRHEADVLAVLLGGDTKAKLLRDVADFRLGHATQREAQIVDLFLRSREQEITLVAVGIDRTEEGAMRTIGVAADIVAGRKGGGAQIAGSLEQIREFYGLVARYTGNRGFARDIARGKRVDDRLAEPFLIVEHIMRNAQGLGNTARIVDIAAGAAGAGAVRGRAMIVKLQRHADDVVALTLQDAGDDR